MKRFSFYHLLLGGLLVGLLYFGGFSVLSLIELGRLERRLLGLSTELDRLRQVNGELSRQLALQSNLDTAAAALARYGWRRSNELLVSIEPPPLRVAEPPATPWRERTLWAALLASALTAAFFIWRSIRLSRKPASAAVASVVTTPGSAPGSGAEPPALPKS